ncbi:MAG: outer membrane homotrimeric porin [Mailhella sp.]|nr:outer membrane homotrimeric porin [Mailhella sp.]
MKKLLTLGLAAGMVMAASAPASAVDVKMDGTFLFWYDWAKSYNTAKGASNAQYEKVTIGATFTASEALSGYFQLMGKWSMGNAKHGAHAAADSFALDAGGGGLGNYPEAVIYKAYIDWLVPGTDLKIRMGRQNLALPHTAMVKNPVIWQSGFADGISASYKFCDKFNVAGWWARYDRQDSAGVGFQTHKANTADLFALIGTAKINGFQFQPYFAFAAVDKNAISSTCNGFKNGPRGWEDSNDTYWFGIGAQMTLFDPLVVKADFIYGDRDWRHADVYEGSQHGWVIDGSVSYKTAYGTPSLSAWYGSGDGKGASYRGQKHLPSIIGRNGISQGFFNGTYLQDNVMVNDDGNCQTYAGTWGVKLAMDGISFLQDLKHGVAVVYGQGTNDARALKAAAGYAGSMNPWQYMTEKDSFVEFDFTTTYKIYKNLSADFSLAYVIEDFKTSKSGGSFAGRANKYDNGWGIGAQIKYAF